MAGAAARRHAQAAFQIALERDELELWRGDLLRLDEALAEPLLASFLESPRVHFEAKAQMLGRAVEGLNPLAMNLALLLISRGRLGLVPDIALEYGRLVDEQQGIAHAEVVTAVPLEKGDQERLVRRLGELLRCRIVLAAKVDPSIIGGLVARVGDKLIDGSTKARFSSLRQSLVR